MSNDYMLAMPEEITVSLKKIGSTIIIRPDDLPENSRTHIFNYGLRQLLNDAMASHKAEDMVSDKAKAAARKDAEDRLANLYAGTLRASRESDPVAAEARKQAGEIIDAALAEKYGSAKKAGEAKDDYDRAELIRELLSGSNGDAIRAQAKVVVEAKAALPKITVKL